MDTATSTWKLTSSAMRRCKHAEELKQTKIAFPSRVLSASALGRVSTVINNHCALPVVRIHAASRMWSPGLSVISFSIVAPPRMRGIRNVFRIAKERTSRRVRQVPIRRHARLWRGNAPAPQIAKNIGRPEDRPTEQGRKKSIEIRFLPPGMAAFPIIDHDRNKVVHQPPGLRLIGVLALPDSILTAACKQNEARVRLHNEPHAEASLLVDDSGHQIEARNEQEAEESDPHD